jgi:hypothetical protein
MRLFVGYQHRLGWLQTVREQFGHLSTMDLTLHNEMLHRPILPGSTL